MLTAPSATTVRFPHSYRSLLAQYLRKLGFEENARTLKSIKNKELVEIRLSLFVGDTFALASTGAFG